MLIGANRPATLPSRRVAGRWFSAWAQRPRRGYGVGRGGSAGVCFRMGEAYPPPASPPPRFNLSFILSGTWAYTLAMEHATPARFLASHEATAATSFLAADFLTALPRGRSARQLHRQLPPPQAGLLVSVIIPAKNEAANLPATLAALAAQTDHAGRPLPPASFEVIVLANNCVDATAAVVRQQARRFPHLALYAAELCLPPAQAHVGRARRLLMDAACARLEHVGRPAGIIASTDADTCVAPTWLAALQAEILVGADAVGGRILTQPTGRAACPVRRLEVRDAAYRVLCARLEDLLDPAPADPWPRHHQHFGASLALTARAYRRAGGLPEVRFLEDEALWQALRRCDLRLRHSPAVQVRTSARRQGRVEVGLSWQLREWQHLSQQQREPQAENPAYLAAQWRVRRQLRALWADPTAGDCGALAARLQLPAAALRARVRGTPALGELWEWVRATSPALPVPLLPLSQALRELPRLIQRLIQRHGCSPAAPAGGLSAAPAGRAGTVRAAAR